MSEPTLEMYFTKFLQNRGYKVEVQPDYPSSIDIMGVKRDGLVLIELKSKDRIDASDVAQVKSYEELLRRHTKVKSSGTISFIYTKGLVTGSAQQLSREYGVEILKPGQLDRFSSHRVFKEK